MERVKQHFQIDFWGKVGGEGSGLGQGEFFAQKPFPNSHLLPQFVPVRVQGELLPKTAQKWGRGKASQSFFSRIHLNPEETLQQFGF